MPTKPTARHARPDWATDLDNTYSLLDWLRENDFTPSEDGGWFDHANIRVAFDDTDVIVYRFYGLGVLDWEVRMRNTSLPYTITIIEGALRQA